MLTIEKYWDIEVPQAKGYITQEIAEYLSSRYNKKTRAMLTEDEIINIVHSEMLAFEII